MLFNLSSVVVLTLAAISVASPVSNPDKKAKVAKSVTYNGPADSAVAKCGARSYTGAQIKAAVMAGASNDDKKAKQGKNKYPHYFGRKNGAETSVLVWDKDCTESAMSAKLTEFPILSGGGIYKETIKGTSQGDDRVMFNYMVGDATIYFCGVLTHEGAASVGGAARNFITCPLTG